MSETSIRVHQESIRVEASAEAVYDLVSDITRTGEWSPVCVSCWWDDEETRSEVIAAERGREFAWIVGGRAHRGVRHRGGGSGVTAHRRARPDRSGRRSDCSCSAPQPRGSRTSEPIPPVGSSPLEVPTRQPSQEALTGMRRAYCSSVTMRGEVWGS